MLKQRNTSVCGSSEAFERKLSWYLSFPSFPAGGELEVVNRSDC